MSLNDTIAIVTGANRGIGLAIARRFAADGATVVAACRDAAAGDVVAESLRAAGGASDAITADIRVPEDCARLVAAVQERHGRIDVLCNNAGVGLLRTVVDTTLEDYEYVMDTNVRGAFLLSKHAIPGMLERGRGAIVNLASVASFVGFQRDAAYCTSKGALLMLTRQLALEYARAGVRVNAICPGFVDTPELRHYVAQQEDPETALQACVDAHPIGRVGRPEEIAAAAAFLASDEASFVTGEALVVDGGMLTR